MRELHLDPMAGAWGAAGPVGPAAAPEQPTQARALPAPWGGSWDLRPWPAPGLGLGPPRTWPLGRSGCGSGPAQESGAGQTERRGPGDRVGQHRKCGASPPPAHGWSGQWVTSSGQHPGAERQPSLWVGGASAFGVPCPPRA